MKIVDLETDTVKYRTTTIALQKRILSPVEYLRWNIFE